MTTMRLEITIGKMTGQQNDDLTLLQLISQGDEEALTTLYTRHGGKLYGYALRILRVPSTAEDVLQESMLTIWQRAQSYRGEGQVLAWLFGIIHHKAMRAYREKVHIPLDETIQNHNEMNTHIDEGLISQDLREMLQDGLAVLSVEHRTVLELVFYQEMTMIEISQICGIPLGTVKSRLNYAKKALKRVLSRQVEALKDLP